MTNTPQASSWTFLTNHTHVMFCLSRDPGMRMKDIAGEVGITERAVQHIVADLRAAGYLVGEREGRRVRYTILRDQRLRHPLESGCCIGDVLEVLERLTGAAR
ncbi:MarR family protein [Desulfomicrobium apsheronum]|uniref:MarR family protein n=1 Tax=Desulfomicrobium apsheronum TaxID=52560 RepID=A0A1I3XZ27_9BACT|nr:winged helix-turn-helix domain-containing protein [Desulfomicrobium apsheronum]SFK24887.1 MarR family protein [Desulfomicrobium apsheronum]